MRKTNIALVIALAFIGTAEAAVVYKSDDAKLEVGGRLNAALNSVEISKSDDKKVELVGTARLRVAAESKIVDGLKALAFGEWQIGAETSHNGQWDTRFAYVGFKTDNYGQLVFGQNRTAIHQVLAATDIFIDWGSAGHTHYEYASKGRQEGLIHYQYKKDFENSDQLKFGLSYQTAGLDNVESGVATAIGYEFGTAFPVGADIGYDYYDVADNAPAKYDNRNSLAVSLHGGELSSGFYVGALYDFTDYEHKENVNGWELALGYTWDAGFQLLAEFSEERQDNALIVSKITGELSYKFNPNFRAYIETEIGVGDIDKVDSVTGKKIASTEERADDKVAFNLQYNY